MYLPTMPLNLQVINQRYHSTQDYNFTPNTLYVWPDGSIKQNIGGFGVFMETHIITGKVSFISNKIASWNMALGRQYDINFVEGKGIYSALNELYTTYKNLLPNYSIIHIITDNKNIFNWITQKEHTTEPYNYNLVKTIYKKMQQIDELYLNIRIQWCERGIWHGNNEADILAKQSVDDYIKFGGLKYGNYQTPISSNILKTYIKNAWKNIKYTNIKNMNNIAVISRNMEIWNIYDEKQPIIWDMKQYNKTEAGLLTQLRTEHIHLNWYFHVRKHYLIYKQQIETYGYINETYDCKYHCCADSNDGLCVECDQPETVYHFLIECQ
ncbi:MAG: hypothetical protein GY737_15155, partial [Desulfobacteraceae bacterium]|nr:hypothetical protein [Desulfobacteraceae bacterium]